MAVVDDGVNMNHPDLRSNFVSILDDDHVM